jgi:hypothetical protein
MTYSFFLEGGKQKENLQSERDTERTAQLAGGVSLAVFN